MAMNFLNRLIYLFIKPNIVFKDIKERPDYNGIIFSGIVIIPLSILSSVLIQSKIDFTYPSNFPTFFISIFEFITLFTTVYASVIGLATTWIFITFFVFIVGKLMKKKILFRDLLPATSYVLIPSILIYVIDFIMDFGLNSITINLGNNNSSVKILEMTNQFYNNPIYLISRFLVLLIIIILLSFVLSLYIEIDLIKSYIISFTYLAFELMRLALTIIFLPFLISFLGQFQKFQ